MKKKRKTRASGRAPWPRPMLPSQGPSLRCRRTWSGSQHGAVLSPSSYAVAYFLFWGGIKYKDIENCLMKSQVSVAQTSRSNVGCPPRPRSSTSRRPCPLAHGSEASQQVYEPSDMIKSPLPHLRVYVIDLSLCASYIHLLFPLNILFLRISTLMCVTSVNTHWHSIPISEHTRTLFL